MRFAYLRDPLFLFCFVLYFVNRLVLKNVSDIEFFHNYLNDLICIPFWVPIMLFALQKLGLRKDDGIPRAHEVIIPLLVWSVVFELLLPRMGTFEGLAFADCQDVLFYALGALASTVFWKSWYGQKADSRSSAPDAPL